MEDDSMIFYLFRIAITMLFYFVPAVIVKKIILPKFTITTKVKILTMILLWIFCLTLFTTFYFVTTGDLPTSSKLGLWISIDYFYIFGIKGKGKGKKKVKVTKYDELYKDMNEFKKRARLTKEDPASTNEEAPCVKIPSAPITPLEEIKCDELYKEMDEFEERTRLTKEDSASINEEAPCVEIPSTPITPLEEIHLEENPTEQPTNDRASLLSQLGNLSEDELKAVVKLASALSSIKEDKQKD